MYWFTLLLPGVISEMTINIFGSPHPRVEVSGSQTDINALHIDDPELKEAAFKSESNKPSDIFLRSPTPWDDLYKRYNWPQISRTLVPKNAKILSYRAEETVIASRNFHNEGAYPITYSAAVTQVEENTIRHFWSRTSFAIVTQKIDYNINVGKNGTDKISSQYSYQEDGVNNIPVTLGSKTKASITLLPNETAVAVLTALKGEINIEVEFEDSLSGYAVENYALLNNDHHFWVFDINSLFEAAGLPKTVSCMETMTIGFFADEKVTIFNLNGTVFQ